MKKNLHILQSKLSAPALSHTLNRDRLTQSLKKILHKKLALVIAGAGYGKTTLVAQTIKDLDADTAWYSIDASDKDPVVFIGHLLASIQKHRSDFGTDLWSKLPSVTISQDIRRKLITAFLVKIEQYTDDLIIVLDDYHLAHDCPEIADIIESMLSRIPPNLHLILISRKDPKLRLSRYRAGWEIIELGEIDLSFRVEEIEALYQNLLQTDIGPVNIQKIHSKTGGWAAALLLFFNALQGYSADELYEKMNAIEKSNKLVFNYLEENVFENQSHGNQQFMMKSSLFNRIDPDLCNSVFKIDDAHIILNELCENHLLTFPCGDGKNSYQYHQLFREFLQIRLIKQQGKDKVLHYHYDIGKALEGSGDLHGALHHFVEGEHFEEIGRVITGLMLLDIREIPIPFLKSTLDQVPAELIRENARLLYIKAKLMSIGGDIWGAINRFETALASFRRDEDETGIANCLKDLGFHYYLIGDLRRAIREMNALWGRPHKDPFFPVEVAGYLILFSAIVGDVDEADRYYNAALKAFAAAEKIETAFIQTWLALCHSFRFHVAGNFRKADARNTKALDFFQRMNLEIFLPITNFQAALTTFYLTNASRGYEYAQEGIRIAEKLGVFDNQYAWLLYGRALNGFGMGMVEQALEDAEEALELFNIYNNVWGQASVLEFKAMQYRKQGNLKEALDVVKEGLEIIHGFDLGTTQGALALELSEILTRLGQHNQAEQVLAQHQPVIRISKFNMFRYHLIRARIDSDQNASERALEHAQSALSIAQANGYDGWFELHSPWLISLMVECYGQHQHTDYIERLFMDANPEADKALEVLRKNTNNRVRRASEKLRSALPHKVPAPLIICCLGPFSVSIGDRPILKKQWRSSKAALLFKYMVIKHAQGLIPKEILLELAWPGDEAAASSPRLHVALNFLRKLFEPELKRGVPSAYIIRQNSGYRLEIGQNGRIDFIDFFQHIDNAGSMEASNADLALKQYLAAESIYKGPLFEEDPYEDWLTEDRDRLKERYLYVLAKIIDLYTKAEAWQDSIAYAEKYLTHDKYEEPVYRQLMQLYANTGNLARVTETFQKCETNIIDGMGCPLSQQTEDLYKKLTAG